jgi:hypothetical protein
MRCAVVRDERLLARIISLAHRFGCTHDYVASHRVGAGYRLEFAFSGEADALRRLDVQITKLLDEDKETML